MSILNKNYMTAYFSHIIGTATPSLKVNYIAFISYSKIPLDTDTLLNFPYEVARIAINDSTKTDNNNILTFNFNIPIGECICPITTVSSKDSTSSILTVSSASSFEVNNVIEVETPDGFLERSIIGISGDNITIDTPVNAVLGGDLRKKVTHMILLCDVTSTPSPTTDLCFLTFKVNFYNDGSGVLLINKKFELLQD